MQITRFGGPEVPDVVDLPDPGPQPGQRVYEVSSAGINFADTHRRLSGGPPDACPAPRTQALPGAWPNAAFAMLAAMSP